MARVKATPGERGTQRRGPSAYAGAAPRRRDDRAARRRARARREHRADARRGADGERAAEQDAEPRAPRSLEQPRRGHPLGHRQQPHEREAEHDEHEAAICLARLGVDEPPTAAAPAPRTTKTTEKPAMNGTLEIATRRAVPRSPSRPASTAETAER